MEQMEDNLFDNVIDLLENCSTSSDDNNTDSSSTSSSDDSSSTSSSDDSDYNPLLENDIYEEDLLFPLLHFLNNGRRRQRVEDFLQVVHAKSNEEFREDFRLTRPIVYLLLESLETSGFIPLHDYGKKKSAELCLLMTLWFLNNKEPHRTLANLFNISLSSVFRIIRRIINWLVTLVPEVVTWPEGNNITKVSGKFQEIAGIRNCIGAIDGSHIYINKPEENGRQYFNRKQCYSILLQTVTDSNMKFINIYCGDPGSFHDVRMLRRSELFPVAELEREHIFPNNTFLLGDKGYNGVARNGLSLLLKTMVILR
ncbi:protein ANTAGONIST OF LIKE HETEROCHROMATIN PROTEIN 1-like [Monomorium pharaonis]|uniref:protein ANTAGONIST OF LIKE HETEROCHROMATIN PROTEIN 1-like n=1 Tax=Monomorium pharaonis TaxID=307658 RepID=UPI0017467C6C|nr:protein ANTAGONIST OF LIKE HETEROCHROMATIN PROTEIN 1-like [Monomorium pharaonis]